MAIDVDNLTDDDLSFACICGPESRERTEAVVAWAIEFTKAKDKADLMTHIVYKLNWDYRASITGIPNDQWSAIMTESKDFDTYVQCDDVIDGAAFTLRLYYNKFGKTREDEVQIG